MVCALSRAAGTLGRGFSLTDATDLVALLELIAVSKVALARLMPRFLLGPERTADLMLFCEQGPHAALNAHDLIRFRALTIESGNGLARSFSAAV